MRLELNPVASAILRIEIATALKRGIRVIPVLVEGALMPSAAELPEDLKGLARRHALEASHTRFSADSERLISAIEQVLESARAEQQRKREEQERVGAEQRGREEQERLEAERREKELQQAKRRETERRQQEGQQEERREKERLEAQRRETEALGGISADSRTPASSRIPSKEGAAKLKKPWRVLVVIGSGAAVCLLGFGLFKASPRRPVSIVGSPLPAPAPFSAAAAAPSNSPSPMPQVSQPLPSPTASGVSGIVVLGMTPSASQASPSPTPSGAEWSAEAKRYLDAKDYAKALPPLQKAVEAGNAEALNQLGELYYDGDGRCSRLRPGAPVVPKGRRRGQHGSQAGALVLALKVGSAVLVEALN
jgi:hypothetical protein